MSLEFGRHFYGLGPAAGVFVYVCGFVTAGAENLLLLSFFLGVNTFRGCWSRMLFVFSSFFFLSFFLRGEKFSFYYMCILQHAYIYTPSSSFSLFSRVDLYSIINFLAARVKQQKASTFPPRPLWRL